MRAAFQRELIERVFDRLTITFSTLRLNHRWVIDCSTGRTKLVFDQPFFLPLSFAFEVDPHEFMGMGKVISNFECGRLFPEHGHAPCRFWGSHEVCEPDPAEVERRKPVAEKTP